MSIFADLPSLLEQAVNAFSKRDFLVANEMFESICRKEPDNYSARYFYAMTLCSIGDFSEARAQLNYILRCSNEAIWWQAARGGLALVDARESSFKKSLAGLI